MVSYIDTESFQSRTMFFKKAPRLSKDVVKDFYSLSSKRAIHLSKVEGDIGLPLPALYFRVTQTLRREVYLDSGEDFQELRLRQPG